MPQDKLGRQPAFGGERQPVTGPVGGDEDNLEAFRGPGMGGKLQHVAAAPGYQHRDTHQDTGDRLSWLQLS